MTINLDALSATVGEVLTALQTVQADVAELKAAAASDATAQAEIDALNAKLAAAIAPPAPIEPAGSQP